MCMVHMAHGRNVLMACGILESLLQYLDGRCNRIKNYFFPLSQDSVAISLSRFSLKSFRFLSSPSTWYCL